MSEALTIAAAAAVRKSSGAAAGTGGVVAAAAGDPTIIGRKAFASHGKNGEHAAKETIVTSPILHDIDKNTKFKKSDFESVCVNAERICSRKFNYF